jgi:high affinity sulfate transporter 1
MRDAIKGTVETPQASAQGPGVRLPILQGVVPIDRSRVSLDIVAGITLAALAIPEVMGYTKIAGTPVVTGLYTLLIPMALFAVFGSSRHLVVGADSATAAILAAGIGGLTAAGSPEYVALAGLLALITAVLLIVARLSRLSFLADFLSRTVLIGFLTVVGIQVAAGQVPGMLGIPGGGQGTLQTLANDVQQLGQTNVPTLILSLVVIGIILGAKRITKMIPGALIAVVGSIVLSSFVDLTAYGISLRGAVPGGLPQIGLPAANAGYILPLLPVALSCFLVILAQSAATSRAYATRYRERLSEDTDLMGLSLANIGAGLSGAFVVNGSPTKTQMVDGAGGRSQLAHVTTSVIVLAVLLFLTGPLAHLPDAVLAAIVFVIGIELVELTGMRTILAERRAEFWVAVITAATVVFVGVEQGILLAIALSLIVHTRHGYKARNTVLIEQDGHLRPVPVSTPAAALPGLVLYRFTHSMYYANAEQLSTEVMDLLRIGPPPIAWFCMDMTAVDDVDFSAAATLRELCGEIAGRGVRLVFADVSDQVRGELARSGITVLVGRDAIYPSIVDVVAAYRQHAPATRSATSQAT